MQALNNQEYVIISYLSGWDLDDINVHRFDGRIIRVDKAADRAPRSNGGYQGRGGYNSRGGESGGYGAFGFTLLGNFGPLNRD